MESFGTVFGSTPFGVGNLTGGIEVLYNVVSPRRSSTESSDSFDPSRDRIIEKKQKVIKHRRQPYCF